MNCLLIYYTGTYNTRYVSSLVKDKLENMGVVTTLYEIDPTNNEVLQLSQYDIIGLGYPIYGFNAPAAFMRFIKKQHFPAGKKIFIYKNSGETLHANDASSVTTLRHVRRCGADVTNEYHFIMPYNIHFRFDEGLVHEMLGMDEKLADILTYEVLNDISNLKKYHFIHRLITFFVKIQYVGGPVNSFLYRVDRSKCTDCGLCIKTCPAKNIYKDKKGRIRFHHRCLMCMRCSMFCPHNAFHIGYLEGWKVNGRYDLNKIKNTECSKRYITPETTGFFKCYIETYDYISARYEELFGSGDKNDA